MFLFRLIVYTFLIEDVVEMTCREVKHVIPFQAFAGDFLAVRSFPDR